VHEFADVRVYGVEAKTVQTYLPFYLYHHTLTIE